MFQTEKNKLINFENKYRLHCLKILNQLGLKLLQSIYSSNQNDKIVEKVIIKYKR